MCLLTVARSCSGTRAFLTVFCTGPLPYSGSHCHFLFLMCTLHSVLLSTDDSPRHTDKFACENCRFSTLSPGCESKPVCQMRQWQPTSPKSRIVSMPCVASVLPAYAKFESSTRPLTLVGIRNNPGVTHSCFGGRLVADSSGTFPLTAGRCNFPVIRNGSKPEVCGAR